MNKSTDTTSRRHVQNVVTLSSWQGQESACQNLSKMFLHMCESSLFLLVLQLPMQMQNEGKGQRNLNGFLFENQRAGSIFGQHEMKAAQTLWRLGCGCIAVWFLSKWWGRWSLERMKSHQCDWQLHHNIHLLISHLLLNIMHQQMRTLTEALWQLGGCLMTLNLTETLNHTLCCGSTGERGDPNSKQPSRGHCDFAPACSLGHQSVLSYTIKKYRDRERKSWLIIKKRQSKSCFSEVQKYVLFGEYQKLFLLSTFHTLTASFWSVTSKNT